MFARLLAQKVSVISSGKKFIHHIHMYRTYRPNVFAAKNDGSSQFIKGMISAIKAA